MEVRFYTNPRGDRPVQDYIADLDDEERGRVDDAIAELLEADRMEEVQVVTRHIEERLWELKVSRHRIFYVLVTGPIVVLLHAYKKQGQRAPPRELDVARRRMKEVLDG